MVFLDANILLEIALANRPNYAAVKQLLGSIRQETAISLLTVHLVLHFGRQAGAEDAFLHAVINENKLLPLLPEDYEWATNNEQGRDFEDALQLAAAVRYGCDTVVTQDVKFAKRYADWPIEFLLPAKEKNLWDEAADGADELHEDEAHVGYRTDEDYVRAINVLRLELENN